MAFHRTLHTVQSAGHLQYMTRLHLSCIRTPPVHFHQVQSEHCLEHRRAFSYRCIIGNIFKIIRQHARRYITVVATIHGCGRVCRISAGKFSEITAADREVAHTVHQRTLPCSFRTRLAMRHHDMPHPHILQRMAVSRAEQTVIHRLVSHIRLGKLHAVFIVIVHETRHRVNARIQRRRHSQLIVHKHFHIIVQRRIHRLLLAVLMVKVLKLTQLDIAATHSHHHRVRNIFCRQGAPQHRHRHHTPCKYIPYHISIA